MENENVENVEIVESVENVGEVEETAMLYETYQERVLEKLTSIEETQQTLNNNTVVIGAVVTVILIYTWIRNILKR